jgi:hypothetical protein
MPKQAAMHRPQKRGCVEQNQGLHSRRGCNREGKIRLVQAAPLK